MIAAPAQIEGTIDEVIAALQRRHACERNQGCGLPAGHMDPCTPDPEQRHDEPACSTGDTWALCGTHHPDGTMACERNTDAQVCSEENCSAWGRLR